jgi:hypothetical protein
MKTSKLRRALVILASVGLAAVTFAQPAHAETAYGIMNAATNKCVDLPGWYATPRDTPVAQYTCDFTYNDNQLWFVRQTRDYVDGYKPVVQFVNAKSGLCLDLPGYGAVAATTRVSTFDCNAVPANDNQEWILEYAPGYGSNSYYRVINLKSNLCLDVAGWASDGSDLANDAPLTVYYCYNGAWANGGYDDHTWRIV